ncbi:hypothetical protein STVA_24760 [Allostella vacuolata]|nr:hypothetical protein STVA_24760 [Stella vacuolata]
MDEFPALGYLPNLLPSLKQFREAGLRAHLIAQNPGQVLQVYGQDGLRRLWGAPNTGSSSASPTPSKPACCRTGWASVPCAPKTGARKGKLGRDWQGCR